MLTPKQVSEKRFKQAFVGGYDMTGVDAFLETLTDDYTALFNENAILKNKVRILVDKLEEYRKVDDSMRQALLGAKKMAEKIKGDAVEQSHQIMENLNNELEARKERIRTDLKLEEIRLKKAKDQTVTFVNSLREIYQRQIDQLALIPTMEAPTPSPRNEREAATAQTAREIEQAVGAKLREDAQMPPAPTPPPPPPSPPPEPPKTVKSAPPAEETRVTPPPSQETEEEPLQVYEVLFGDSDNLSEQDAQSMWEAEHDTEVPRPRFNFTDLESQFGAENTIVVDRRRR